MGYRSTFISRHGVGQLPQWFLDEYQNDIINPCGTLIMSNRELKDIDDIFWDYQKALVEIDYFDNEFSRMHIVVLGESGYVTKVHIKKDTVEFNWEGWEDNDFGKSFRL
jgi:hypothetical protein